MTSHKKLSIFLMVLLNGIWLFPVNISGSPAFSSGQTIRGIVIDHSTNQPLQGANVYIEGTTHGTATGADGMFAITVSRHHNNGVLVISYIGFQTRRHEISELNADEIHQFHLMPENMHRHGELVVTADQAHMTYSGVYSDVKTRPLEDHMTTIPGMDMVSRANFAKDPVIRGLRDGRVNVMIDGMRMTPACVDGMDPITAYIETDNLESINIQRGGQNASSAPGGTLNFNMVKPGLNTGWNGNAEAGFHSVSTQQIYQGSLNYGTETWAARVSGTYRNAGDFATGSGEKIALSGFRKGNVYGSVLYKPAPGHDFSLQYIGDFAGDVGYPALIMDTRRADAHIAGLEHNWQQPGRRVSSIKTKLYINRVEHWMDDYDRDVTGRDVMQNMYMPMFGETTTFGLNSDLNISISENHLLSTKIEAFGINAFADMWMYHINPDVADMYLVNLGDISTRNAALSGSYRYFTNNSWVLGADLRVETGLNQLKKEETYRAEYPGLNNLEPSFFVYTAGLHAERQFSDTFTSGLKLSDGYRMPDHMELYGYYIYHPLDNFFYYGNPGLEKEHSRQAELFFTYGNDNTTFHGNASFWVNRMDNYIAGTMIDELFKRYQNMGRAILTGVEIDLHYNFTRHLHGGTSLAYVLGEHSELNEPLPMIPPVKGSAFLQKHADIYSLETRIRWAAAQSRIAEQNSVETRTDGYVLWDFFGSVNILSNIRLQAGVENILNTFYTDHLSVNSIPSPGRNVSISLRYSL